MPSSPITTFTGAPDFGPSFGSTKKTRFPASAPAALPASANNPGNANTAAESRQSPDQFNTDSFG